MKINYIKFKWSDISERCFVIDGKVEFVDEFIVFRAKRREVEQKVICEADETNVYYIKRKDVEWMSGT